MPEYFGGPYRFRTFIRSYLPFFLVDLGLSAKGDDCEKKGGKHEWYNVVSENSACYHCKVKAKGKLWELKE